MVKKYIIMAGGEYQHWEKPRHLSIVRGEEIIARTIRLLKENGIEDISISTNNPIFEKFGLPILNHNNSYKTKWHSAEGDWLDCFYPTNEPVCYILGDVYFSDEAIKTIVEKETDDIELFGSIPPFAKNYIKKHIEAFAVKVANIKHFWEAIEKTRELAKQDVFWRKPPIIWELWEVIKDVPIQKTKEDEYIFNYTKINDYTCDVDWEEDIKKLNIKLGGYKMIKVEVIKDFTLEKYDELTNVVKKFGVEEQGKLRVGDIFECTQEMCDYLTGNNIKGEVVVKVIEVIPEIVIGNTKVIEEEKKPKKKKTSKK